MTGEEFSPTRYQSNTLPQLINGGNLAWFSKAVQK